MMAASWGDEEPERTRVEDALRLSTREINKLQQLLYEVEDVPDPVEQPAAFPPTNVRTQWACAWTRHTHAAIFIFFVPQDHDHNAIAYCTVVLMLLFIVTVSLALCNSEGGPGAPDVGCHGGRPHGGRTDQQGLLRAAQ